jgi:hypothetical protein
MDVEAQCRGRFDAAGHIQNQLAGEVSDNSINKFESVCIQP